MLKQKLMTFVIVILTFSLGAAGIVTAYTSIPTMSVQFVPDVTESSPEPLSHQKDSVDAAPDESTEESKSSPSVIEPSPKLKPPRAIAGRAAALNSWFQAESANKQLDGEAGMVRLHVIFMDESRTIVGRIEALGAAIETLSEEGNPVEINFLRDGGIVETATLGPNGRFSVSGLDRGPYGIAVVGTNTILSYSVYLGTIEDLEVAGYSPEEIADVFEQQFLKPLQIDSVGIAPVDYPMARKLMEEYASMGYEARRAVNRGTLDIPPGIDFAKAAHGTTLDTHYVRVMEDGSLVGRIRKPIDLPNGKVGIVEVPGVELIFLQNNAAVATTVTDESGAFIVPQIVPGNYSLVAQSMDGMAALGVTILPFNQRRVTESRSIFGRDGESLLYDLCNRKNPHILSSTETV